MFKHTEIVLLMKVLVVASLFTDGVYGVITATRKATQNGTLAENITIVWKIHGMMRATLKIYVDAIASGNQICGVDVINFKASIQFSQQGNKEVAGRSSAVYHYLGNVGGIETGEIVFNIKSLTLNDGREFILLNGFDNVTATTIFVNYPGVKCGEVLMEEYTVKQGEQFQATSGFCGKPQPTVTCSLNGVDYGNPNIIEVNKHNYTYTITLPEKLTPCAMKVIICVVKSYDNSFYKETITVRGEFSSNLKSENLSRNIEFIRKCSDCPLLSWVKNIDTGECDVRYQISFLNGTNVISAPVVLSDNSYSSCTIQVQNVKVSTYVYGNILNRVYKLLGNDTSELVDLVDIPCQTTTTATTARIKSSTTPGSFEIKEEQKENQCQLKENTIIVLSVITSMSLILNFTILISVKTGKIKCELVRKQNEKYEEKGKAEPQELQLKETVSKQPSDYMELQAARKDMTYQDLTTVRDNSKYEVYYKDV